MNDLTTILRQRILIVYSDIEWRDEMFSKVLDIYPHDMINKMIKSRCGCWIELVDGTMVRFVYANDSARGIKARGLHTDRYIMTNLLQKQISKKEVKLWDTQTVHL